MGGEIFGGDDENVLELDNKLDSGNIRWGAVAHT